MDQQVIDALTQAFTGAEVELETLPDGRYPGLLIWDGFIDKDSMDRQQLVRKVLKSALHSESAKVGILFTYTPTEIAATCAA